MKKRALTTSLATSTALLFGACSDNPEVASTFSRAAERPSCEALSESVSFDAFVAEQGMGLNLELLSETLDTSVKGLFANGEVAEVSCFPSLSERFVNSGSALMNLADMLCTPVIVFVDNATVGENGETMVSDFGVVCVPETSQV